MPPKLHDPGRFQFPDAALAMFADGRVNTSIVPADAQVEEIVQEHFNMVKADGPELQQFMHSRYRVFATKTMLRRATQVHVINSSPLVQ